MEKGHGANAGFVRARQLIKITEAELGRPIAGARVLTAGEGELALELRSLLKGGGAAAEDIGGLQKGAPGALFDAAILLEPADDGLLRPLMAPGSVIVDAACYGEGGAVFYDSSLPYRKIRVIALAAPNGAGR